jgi:hypothetical protein
MVRRYAATLVIASACGSPSLPSGAIACGPGGECPDGMSCARELCWTDPPGEWDAGWPDAAAADAAVLPTELAVEAEAFDDLVVLLGTAGSAQWTVRDDDATASSGSYLRALPNDGINCLDMPPTDCGAVVIYQMPPMAAGTYYLHLLSSTAGPADDSVFYGIDGNVIDFAGLPDGLAWTWRRFTLDVLLDEAPHELHLWVREDGAGLDRVVVSQSTQTPP